MGSIGSLMRRPGSRTRSRGSDAASSAATSAQTIIPRSMVHRVIAQSTTLRYPGRVRHDAVCRRSMRPPHAAPPEVDREAALERREREGLAHSPALARERRVVWLVARPTLGRRRCVRTRRATRASPSARRDRNILVATATKSDRPCDEQRDGRPRARGKRFAGAMAMARTPRRLVGDVRQVRAPLARTIEIPRAVLTRTKGRDRAHLRGGPDDGSGGVAASSARASALKSERESRGTERDPCLYAWSSSTDEPPESGRPSGARVVRFTHSGCECLAPCHGTGIMELGRRDGRRSSLGEIWSRSECRAPAIVGISRSDGWTDPYLRLQRAASVPAIDLGDSGPRRQTFVRLTSRGVLPREYGPVRTHARPRPENSYVARSSIARGVISRQHGDEGRAAAAPPRRGLGRRRRLVSAAER